MNKLSTNLKEQALQKNHWELRYTNHLPLLVSPLLAQYAQLTHAFSTRLGGKSALPRESFNLGRTNLSEEGRLDAIANAEKLCQSLNLKAENLVVPGMSHSKKVVLIDEPQRIKEVDGIATRARHIPVLLSFADCVPIVIFDRSQEVFAVVHAGWRGTASGIACEAVKLLIERCNSRPQHLVAAIGPAIGSCCYPTRVDVAVQLTRSIISNSHDLTEDIFSKKIGALALHEFFVVSDEGINCDLKAINAYQLLASGVAQVDVTSRCTACEPELFYSHRQSGGKTGRQGVIAALI